MPDRPVATNRWRKKGARLSASLALAGVLALAGIVVVADPAAATSCSSLGVSGQKIVGSCTGYPRVSVEWACTGGGVHIRGFSTSPGLPGLSFSFYHGCSRGVQWVRPL